MTTLAFDTLAFADKLKESGMPAQQAEAQARAMAAALEASRQDLVSKADFAEFRAEVKGDFTLVKWMLGSLIALALGIAMKLFLHG